MKNNIRWLNGKKIDQNKILEIEKKLDFELPIVYKEIVESFNGGRVEPYFFGTESGDESIVDELFNIEEIYLLKDKFDKEYKKDIPEDHEDLIHYTSLVPFAYDPGVNHLCFDYYQREKPAVIFLTDVYNIDFVAETFEEFLEGLYAESIDDDD